MKSLIRYGLEAVGFADIFWSAVLVLLNMSFLPLTVSFTSLYHVSHVPVKIAVAML